MSGGMVVSKSLTGKIDALVRVFKDTTGFTLSRSQVLERLVDGELSLHKPKQKRGAAAVVIPTEATPEEVA